MCLTDPKVEEPFSFSPPSNATASRVDKFYPPEAAWPTIAEPCQIRQITSKSDRRRRDHKSA
jgi:hypothetical protein